MDRTMWKDRFRRGFEPVVRLLDDVDTRSDSKVMRLVLKEIILFIHQLQCGHLQSTYLVPAHTFSSGAAIVTALLERSLWVVV